MANGNIDLSRILQQQGSSGLQLSPARQSQVELARGLANQSMSGAPVRGGPVEALSRVGQAFFARQMLDEAQQARDERQQRLAETLQSAVQAGQPQPSPIQEQGGVGAVGALALMNDPQARVPQTQNTPQERRQAVLNALLENPDTAPAAGQIALSQALQGPQDQSRTISGEQANRMFGSQLAPGAAVTVEGNQETGFSIADVQEPSQSGRVRTLSREQKQQFGFPEGSVVQQKPDGSFSVKFKPSDQGQDQTRTISGEQANRMFGTQLAPGAAVTVEGNQETGFSVADVQEPFTQEPQSRKVPMSGAQANRRLGTNTFGENETVVFEIDPQGGISISDRFSPQEGESQLPGRTRAAIALNRRSRGEETGTAFDQLSPERADQVGELIFSEPQRYQFGADQFGRPTITDTQTGDTRLATELPPPVNPNLGQDTQETQGAQQEGQQQSIVGDVTIGEGELGVVGQLQRLGNVLSPQFGGQLTSPERTELETNLRGLREQLTSVLRDNRRLLSVQVEEIRNQVPSPDSLLESSPNAIASMLSLRTRLADQRDRAVALARNNKAPIQEREDASGFARELQGIIDQLAVPPSLFDQADPEQAFEFAQSLTPSTARQLSPNSAESLINRLSTDQLSQLGVRTIQTLQGLLGNDEGQ